MIEPPVPESGIPAYVYTTYIRATPEQVWNAISDRELTGRFWGHAQVSDWAVGSRVDHVSTDDTHIADAAGRVIAVDPPRRLVFSFGDPRRLDDPDRKPSIVTFEIEPDRDIVRLTVIHAGLTSTEELHDSSQAWPAVLANLKTLLETGEVLPHAPWEFRVDDRIVNMAENP